MRLFFASQEITDLYKYETNAQDYSEDAIDSFFYHLEAIAAAESEADLLMLQSLPLRPHGGSYLLQLDEHRSLTLSITASNNLETIEVDLLNVKERSVS